MSHIEKEKLIKADLLSIENRVRHAFNQGYELGRKDATPKKNLGVDTISRADARSLICNTDIKHHMFGMSRKVFKDLYNGIDELPSVTPQEPQSFKWCTDCKEYDQEKHCCHRWSKVIRNTVEEMKQEQEPVYTSQIAQKAYEDGKKDGYVQAKLEQEPIIDKIRAEIKALSPEPTAYDVVDGNPVKDAIWEILIEVDKIIDKYKGESEG